MINLDNNGKAILNLEFLVTQNTENIPFLFTFEDEYYTQSITISLTHSFRDSRFTEFDFSTFSQLNNLLNESFTVHWSVELLGETLQSGLIRKKI